MFALLPNINVFFETSVFLYSKRIFLENWMFIWMFKKTFATYIQKRNAHKHRLLQNKRVHIVQAMECGTTNRHKYNISVKY